MRVDTELQNKAIHLILMRIREKWRQIPSAKRGGLDHGGLTSAQAEEKLRNMQGIRKGETDLKETIILSPHASTMNSETPLQKFDAPEQTRAGGKAEGLSKEIHETVILSTSSPSAGSTALSSGKGKMEQTHIVVDPVDPKGKRGYPPKNPDIYETVILSPQGLSAEASSLKEKGKLLDTVLVRRPEASMEPKTGEEPLVQGTAKGSTSEWKDFDKAKKPQKKTGGDFLEQTVLVGSQNEKERG